MPIVTKARARLNCHALQHERSYMFLNNKLVERIDGNGHSVAPTAVKDGHMIHNHPHPGQWLCLSFADVNWAIYYNLQAIEATDPHRRRVIMRRPKDGWPDVYIPPHCSRLAGHWNAVTKSVANEYGLVFERGTF